MIAIQLRCLLSFKGNGNKTAEILLLVRSDSVITEGGQFVDVKLVQLSLGLYGEVFIWLEGPIFFLWEAKPFDVVKNAILAFDGSHYPVHVVLLICLYVGYLSQDFLILNWAIPWNKRFNLHNVECQVSSPLVRKH